MLASERFIKSLEKKGRQEGRQDQEGREEERKEIILNIYRETSWSAKKISEITKFPEPYIQSVIERFDDVKKI